MSHHTRIRANLAAWALNSALLPAEIDALDAAQFAAIDGDAGGLWTPSAKIIVAGVSGLDVAAPFRALGASGFNASMQAQNWPERPTVASTSTAATDVPIAWDNPVTGIYRYCALSFDTNSFTSEDGENWVNRSSYGGIFPTGSYGPAADIAAGVSSATPVFLATSVAGPGVIKTIDGGTTWTNPGSSGVTRAALVYSPSLGLWVAAGNSGLIATSPDGTTWTARTTPAGWIAGCGGAKKIVWSSVTAVFVVIPRGTYNKFLTSPDGVTWTERTVTGSAADWGGVAYGAYDGRWMAVSRGGDVWTSGDGLSWVNAAPTGVYGMQGLAVSQSLWIGAVLNGNAGTIHWSTNAGSTWQSTQVGYTSSALGWSRIIAADNRFVMARASGTNLEFALSLRSS